MSEENSFYYTSEENNSRQHNDFCMSISNTYQKKLQTVFFPDAYGENINFLYHSKQEDNWR